MVSCAPVKLYRFDGIDEELDLVPLSARRALDHAGLKLSRMGWRSLSLEARRQLVAAGAAARVEVDAVRRLCRKASPAPAQVGAADDPPPAAPPAEVLAAFGAGRPLTDSLWSTLTPLDRYVLAKVASRGRADRIDGAYQEIVGASSVSTHLSAAGGARMIDVADKPPSLRRAEAESAITMSADAFERLRCADAAKGDVLGVARIAAIQAAKKTSDLIPLCHQLQLTRVGIDFELQREGRRVRVSAQVETTDRTGVEMEALVAASVAALTIYDMLKAYDRSMELGPTRLTQKSGGRSGDYRR